MKETSLNCQCMQNQIFIKTFRYLSKDLFQGGCNFQIKNKQKSGIFNDKKVYKQGCFALS